MSVDFDRDLLTWRSGQETTFRTVVDAHLVALLTLVSLLAETLAVSRVVLRHARPPLTPDAAVFQHMGWYLVNGGALYVDMWEPKLPLPYETTAALALFTGDDMYALHLANVALMALAVAGIVVLVGVLARDIAGDPVAGLVAGLSMFLLPGFHLRPAYGFKAKYLLLLCGLLAIWLFLRDRPALAGGAAAASVGYWQLGAVFPLVLLGLAAHRRDRRAFGRIVAGGGLFAALMLLPVAIQGALGHLLVQAVIAPLVLPDPASLPLRLYAGVVHFKYATPLVLAGALGLATFARSRSVAEHWWVLAGAAWFALVVFFVDFETGGYTDLVPGLAFVALGLGLLYADAGRAVRRTILVGVVGVVALNLLFLGGFGVAFEPVSTPGPTPMDDLQVTSDRAVLQNPVIPNDVPDVRYLYWNHVRPDSCHYRLSTNEVRWLERTGGYGNGCMGLVDALRTFGWLP